LQVTGLWVGDESLEHLGNSGVRFARGVAGLLST
jgi:hypothetical protein